LFTETMKLHLVNLSPPIQLPLEYLRN
jgi:hypothetical protein